MSNFKGRRFLKVFLAPLKHKQKPRSYCRDSSFIVLRFESRSGYRLSYLVPS